MKKKVLVWSCLYYISIPLICAGVLYLLSAILRASGEADNLGAVMFATYGFLFFGMPIMIVVLMRFSLLKWYVDPLAAAEAPLFLYLSGILNQTKRTGDFLAAFQSVNESFCANGGQGWIVLAGFFILGLFASFSFDRKDGKSFSYRMLSKTVT